MAIQSMAVLRLLYFLFPIDYRQCRTYLIGALLIGLMEQKRPRVKFSVIGNVKGVKQVQRRPLLGMLTVVFLRIPVLSMRSSSAVEFFSNLSRPCFWHYHYLPPFVAAVVLASPKVPPQGPFDARGIHDDVRVISYGTSHQYLTNLTGADIF
jgi:hypothetical protein